ncbi:MAG: 4-alpha-glucanotransferase [Pirellulaceae bacterium]|jgi:4-alpha-glucanotransferase|nr:4-alpha-glucanotransferase [Planctomycetota bacterium]NLY99722.1 4-alpha-glucanotransferase [Pirellulaceae bacterium]
MAERALQTLARLYGVQPSYVDVWRKRRWSSHEAVLRALQLLGAPLASAAGAASALRFRRQELWQEMLPPVLAAFGGKAGCPLRVPESLSGTKYRCQLDLEDGASLAFAGRVEDLAIQRAGVVERVAYTRRILPLPDNLPHGYHRLHVELGGRAAESLLIAAPPLTYRPSPRQQRIWGVFLPLYSLHRQSGSAAGDFSDLAALMQWTADRGGNLVATLPLLSILWELSDDPSPYHPASRLFWNELYLDPRRSPGFDSCPAARRLAGDLLAQAAPGDLVDYPGLVRAKRRVTEALAEAFFSRPSPQRDAMLEECRGNPELERFARFRAAGERRQAAWPDWPEPARGGRLAPGDYDERVFQYHLYAQWEVGRQLASLTAHADRRELLWYLDFPLGVSGKGFDVWRNQQLFVGEAAGGAPPDSFFTQGQNWGFPPLHPGRLRRQGYAYLIRSLRNHLRHARILRFDHVMGLHRLYWIPQGFRADDGVYVRYPMEEMCAILTLESHRFGARIVGEDLGTVPAAVDRALQRHGIAPMYVLQYETNPDKGPALREVPAACVASVNTHDMPQFAAYWQGLDIEDRLGQGLLTAEAAAEERRRRAGLRRRITEFLRAQGLLASAEPTCPQVLEACECYLAASDAEILLVNLEDLWGETEPQNRPGTYREHPNWRRKARYPFDQFSAMPEVARVLGAIDRLRRRA